MILTPKNVRTVSKQVFWLSPPLPAFPITLCVISGALSSKGLNPLVRVRITAAGPLPIFTGFPWLECFSNMYKCYMYTTSFLQSQFTFLMAGKLFLIKPGHRRWSPTGIPAYREEITRHFTVPTGRDDRGVTGISRARGDGPGLSAFALRAGS
jgi:hypothetical protein